ncbi:MAG: hypothetical protein ACO2OU_00955 [Thermus aquaticus]|uniref:hypothetical protein n=1 Tax=Thermus aquaticus TaxID=271 RepID=UPI003C054268
MEGDPEALGVVVEGHLQRAVFMGYGKAAGEMATELGEGREEKARNLPEAVGESPRAFLLRGRRGKGYPRGRVKPCRCAHPRGTPRIA